MCKTIKTTGGPVQNTFFFLVETSLGYQERSLHLAAVAHAALFPRPERHQHGLGPTRDDLGCPLKECVNYFILQFTINNTIIVISLDLNVKKLLNFSNFLGNLNPS